MQLVIRSSGIAVFLKTTYDESCKSYAPGILMRRAIFEHLFNDNQTKRIEFYGKVREWQTKWADETRTLYHVNYFRWPWLHYLWRLRAHKDHELGEAG